MLPRTGCRECNAQYNSERELRDHMRTAHRKFASEPRNADVTLFLTSIRDDHELDWLLCLASTFQACQRAIPTSTEEYILRERPMEPSRPKVLLIGETAQDSSYLANHLRRHGCEYKFAVSYEEACSLLGVQSFDLVLSALRPAGNSAFSLVALLEGSTTTLFYSEPVENGCWWLPALRNGQNCFGSSALLPSEFVSVLDEVIEEICFRAAGERKGNQFIGPLLPGSPATMPSSEELPPAEPKRAKGVNSFVRKTAG